MALGAVLERYWNELHEKAEAAAREAESAPVPDRAAKKAVAATLMRKAEDYRKEVLVWLRVVRNATTRALAENRISVLIIDAAKLNAALKRTLKDDWKREYGVAVSVACTVLSMKTPARRTLTRFDKAALESLETGLAALIKEFRTAPG